MSCHRWSTQNQLNGIFVDFLSHFMSFGHFCLFVLVVFLFEYYDLLFCVLWILFVHMFVYVFHVFISFSPLIMFCLFACLSSKKEKDRAWSWCVGSREDLGVVVGGKP